RGPRKRRNVGKPFRGSSRFAPLSQPCDDSSAAAAVGAPGETSKFERAAKTFRSVGCCLRDLSARGDREGFGDVDGAAVGNSNCACLAQIKRPLETERSLRICSSRVCRGCRAIGFGKMWIFDGAGVFSAISWMERTVRIAEHILPKVTRGGRSVEIDSPRQLAGRARRGGAWQIRLRSQIYRECFFLDCVYANVNADRLRRGSGVWFNRRDSKSREPLWLRGFESPPLRHGQLLI